MVWTDFVKTPAKLARHTRRESVDRPASEEAQTPSNLDRRDIIVVSAFEIGAYHGNFHEIVLVPDNSLLQLAVSVQQVHTGLELVSVCAAAAFDLWKDDAASSLESHRKLHSRV